MISIIIPAYNAEKFIGRCLNSIIKQTYQDFQLIVVNDGSTDHTLAILNSYKDNYPDLDFTIVTTENKGHGSARNTGIALANKEYIWFVDADDALYNNKAILNTVLDLREQQPDICIFSALETDFKKRMKVWRYAKKNKLTNIKETPTLVFKQNWSWNKPTKRSFLEETKIKFNSEKMFEDTYFFVELYQQAKKIYITTDVRYIYIKHSEALTSSIKNFKKFPLALLYELKTFMNIVVKK